jgi:uncharacterized protein
MDHQPGSSAGAAKPLWRRIAQFPLVALILALLALLLPLAVMAPLLVAFEALPGWVDEPMISLTSVAVLVVAYKWVVVRLGEEPRDDLPFDRRLLDAPRGAVIGALLISLIVGVAAWLGAYRLTGWGGSTSLPMLLFTAGLQASILEEILVRGVLFRFLEEFGGSWFALVISSALFGFLHLGNDNATVFSSLSIAVEAGIMLGGAYMLTRNLWLAIGLHFGWNFAQGYIWDVPVSGFQVDGLVNAQPAGPDLLSGGPFGLEASVIALGLATTLGTWFVYRAVREGKIVRPWWVRRRFARQSRVLPTAS